MLAALEEKARGRGTRHRPVYIARGRRATNDTRRVSWIARFGRVAWVPRYRCSVCTYDCRPVLEQLGARSNQRLAGQEDRPLAKFQLCPWLSLFWQRRSSTMMFSLSPAGG